MTKKPQDESPELQKVAAAPEIDPDTVELTQADRERIRVKARAQVAAERKKALEAAALESELEKLRGKAGMVTGNPEEDRLVDITIDCGPTSDGPVINGVKRFQGRTYTVPLHVARSLQEIMFRSQSHEDEISGKSRAEAYRRPRHIGINRRNASGIERRVTAGMGADAA